MSPPNRLKVLSAGRGRGGGGYWALTPQQQPGSYRGGDHDDDHDDDDDCDDAADNEISLHTTEDRMCDICLKPLKSFCNGFL